MQEESPYLDIFSHNFLLVTVRNVDFTVYYTEKSYSELFRSDIGNQMQLTLPQKQHIYKISYISRSGL